MKVRPDCAVKSDVAERLQHQSSRWPCTLLGVGVVSRTTVAAAVDLANEHDVDLMLLASRRQVDTAALGGGYVDGWTAGQMAAFVRARDTGGRTLLCRDHGGPWQNSREIETGLPAAVGLSSAKDSFAEDIEAGFAVLHIDTSTSPTGQPSEEEALDRLFDLYHHCVDLARSQGRSIAIEVGTEEQDSLSHSMPRFFATLDRILAFCDEQSLIRPTFTVAQTGTKVMETRNVGLLDSPYRIDGALPSETFVPRLIAGLKDRGLMLKQHNTDYLSDEVLRWHPWLGIHAANVAPEYGVAESRALIRILDAKRLHGLRDRFLELAYQSRKWEKWMLPDTHATDRERAIIAGHYVFSTQAFGEIRDQATRDLAAAGIDLGQYLLERVKHAILRHMAAFRLLRMPS